MFSVVQGGSGIDRHRLLLGFHLGVGFSSVSLFLVGYLLREVSTLAADMIELHRYACLLQPVELLTVQFIELGIDVFDGVFCPRYDDVLDGVDW